MVRVVFFERQLTDAVGAEAVRVQKLTVVIGIVYVFQLIISFAWVGQSSGSSVFNMVMSVLSFLFIGFAIYSLWHKTDRLLLIYFIIKLTLFTLFFISIIVLIVAVDAFSKLIAAGVTQCGSHSCRAAHSVGILSILLSIVVLVLDGAQMVLAFKLRLSILTKQDTYVGAMGGDSYEPPRPLYSPQSENFDEDPPSYISFPTPEQPRYSSAPYVLSDQDSVEYSGQAQFPRYSAQYTPPPPPNPHSSGEYAPLNPPPEERVGSVRFETGNNPFSSDPDPQP